MKQVNYDYIPSEYKPLSPWAYFGLSILFSIPVLGLILLIVFSFSTGNANLRNFARSYFCGLIILIVVAAVLVVLQLTTGVMTSLIDQIKGLIK